MKVVTDSEIVGQDVGQTKKENRGIPVDDKDKLIFELQQKVCSLESQLYGTEA